MALALHLWIQKERGFDQGCWGLGGPAPAAAEGCRDPGLEPVSHFFGVSTAAWGYLFFFAVAGFSLAKVVLPERCAVFFHTALDVVVAAGFPASICLAYYQIFVARAICPLCLVTTALITGIFVVQTVLYFRGGHVPVPANERPDEIGYATGAVFGVGGVLIAVLFFVDQIATRRLDQGATARQFELMVGRSLPRFIDGDRLREMRAAGAPGDGQTLKPEEWIEAGTPFIGVASGPTVVAFFDPNCPHCDTSFASVMRLAEHYKDRARVIVLPRVLWPYSLLQVQALELAREEGKYFEMWQLQFKQQQKDGLNVKQLEALFRQLNLNPTDLKDRLAKVRPAVIAKRDQARDAGINSTPAIFLDGLALTGLDRTENALAKAIEAALKSRKPGVDAALKSDALPANRAVAVP
jgi:protein-disulfide isomerase/uncharacterized membrane protein